VHILWIFIPTSAHFLNFYFNKCTFSEFLFEQVHMLWIFIRTSAHSVKFYSNKCCSLKFYSNKHCSLKFYSNQCCSLKFCLLCTRIPTIYFWS
jgi:hypothetical protein